MAAVFLSKGLVSGKALAAGFVGRSGTGG